MWRRGEKGRGRGLIQRIDDQFPFPAYKHIGTWGSTTTISARLIRIVCIFVPRLRLILLEAAKNNPRAPLSRSYASWVPGTWAGLRYRSDTAAIPMRYQVQGLEGDKIPVHVCFCLVSYFVEF